MSDRSPTSDSSDRFDQALEAAQQQWMDLEGVQAVGQGQQQGRACITVFVDHRRPALARQIPKTFRGIPVEVREGGAISAT